MKRVYIAGPMTGLPGLNFPAFHAEAARLRGLGFDAVNPAEINSDPTAGWAHCMRMDIAQLMTCDMIVLLPGWQHSRGAKLEYMLASTLGIEVMNPEIAMSQALLVPVLREPLDCTKKVAP